MKTKAIIFDIDGTAVDSPDQKIPSDRLKHAVSNISVDYYFCAATGRVWTFAKPVLHGLNLTDPCIISSGTQICNPVTGEIVWQCDIDKPDLELAVDMLQEYSEFKVLYNDYDEDMYLHGGHDVANLVLPSEVYFFEMSFVPEKIAPEVVGKLSSIEGLAVTMVVAQRAGYKDIHVTNRNATKEHAVAELIDILGIDQQDTIGVGDGHNDIHLFNAVGHRVAMGNAVSELKALSDETIGHVKDDGLAVYLESL